MSSFRRKQLTARILVAKIKEIVLMQTRALLSHLFFLFLTSLFLAFFSQSVFSQNCNHWRIHDMNRPKPPVIDPGTASTQEKPGRPPSDAIVLFDGTDLSQWRGVDGGPAKWRVVNGYMETVRGAGYIHTVQNFGNCQLHIEWSAPLPARGKGQARGNSGVFLMGKYEVQVLDSYENETYADGQAAAIYGQYPPMVNASRPPGQWQTYDIIFHRPYFDKNGKLTRPARMTVFHNGILVQDNAVLLGPTLWLNRLPYQVHPPKLPLSLQDHGNPVRYRNIWIRELPDEDEPCGLPEKEISVSEKLLSQYVGEYQVRPGFILKVFREGEFLKMHLVAQQVVALYATSDTEFFSRVLDIRVVFRTNANGEVEGLDLYQGGNIMKAKKIK